MRGTMTDEPALREHLRKLLDWQDAHVGFDKAVADIPAKLRGEKPAQLPYSAWQLIEHLRITQHDILDFCRNLTTTGQPRPLRARPPRGTLVSAATGRIGKRCSSSQWILASI
jgi:hypothetical protein